jgi:hypothetical protein
MFDISAFGQHWILWLRLGHRRLWSVALWPEFGYRQLWPEAATMAGIGQTMGTKLL